nr:glycosyltransferase [Francisella noatunensis]
MLSLNVNTIEDSPTMFSRRLIEILACGGIVITNNTLAVQKMFAKYCHVIETKQQIDEIVERVTRDGLSDDDLVMAKAGSEYVLANFTWTNNLEMIKQVVGLK